MFKSQYVGGKAPYSRVNVVCQRESSIFESSLSENRLEGKLHVQELICWTLFRIQQGKLQRTKSLQGVCGRKAPACPMLAICVQRRQNFQCVREGKLQRV